MSSPPASVSANERNAADERGRHAGHDEQREVGDVQAR